MPQVCSQCQRVMRNQSMANDVSDIVDVCDGLVDTAFPPDVRQVYDLPTKVQFLFLGLALQRSRNPGNRIEKSN